LESAARSCAERIKPLPDTQIIPQSSRAHLRLLWPLLVVLAGLISIYPLFLGRSLAAPQMGGVDLLYDRPPYLPGGSMMRPAFERNSDLGAFAWAWQPWTAVEARAFEAGEMPLWNRYSYAGLALIGQGISQIGDPLHLIPLLGKSSALSWDVQFGLARILFALGCFWAVLRFLDAPRIAAAIGCSSAFIGFFLFRINHAAYFTVCYAPFILVAWLEFIRATRRLTLVASALLLCLASLAVLNAGAIKEGVAVLIILQVTGALLFVCAPMTKNDKLRRLVILLFFAAAGAFFEYPLASAFLETLKNSNTKSDLARAYALPLDLAGGFLDDFLYFRVWIQGFPSLNFALGLCLLWALARAPRLASRSGFIPLLAGMGLAWAFVYGLIPPSLVVKIPFLGHIEHIHEAFSCPLIVLAIAVSGFGLAAMIDDIRTGRWRLPFAICAVLLMAIVGSAILSHPDVKTIDPELRSYDATSVTIPIIISVLTLLTLALPLLAVRFFTNPRPLFAGLFIGIILLALHVRQGLHYATGAARLEHFYLLTPGPRPDYSVPSDSIAWLLKQTRQAPARAIGIGGVLFPGFGATLGLESINGPDPLRPKDVMDLIAAFGLPMEWGWRIHFDDPGAIQRFAPILDFLNVRWLLAWPGASPAPGDLRLHADLDVYERTSAWPRAFFTDRIEHYAKLEDLVARIRRASGPFAALQSSAQTQQAQAQAPARVIAARDYRLRTNGTEFHVDAPGPGLVVLAETLAPGVIATVDGKPVPVLRVDHMYRGIAIDRAGTFDIDFEFAPAYWANAPRAMAIGLIFALFGCALPFATIRPKAGR